MLKGTGLDRACARLSTALTGPDGDTEDGGEQPGSAEEAAAVVPVEAVLAEEAERVMQEILGLQDVLYSHYPPKIGAFCKYNVPCGKMPVEAIRWIVTDLDEHALYKGPLFLVATCHSPRDCTACLHRAQNKDLLFLVRTCYSPRDCISFPCSSASSPGAILLLLRASLPQWPLSLSIAACVPRGLS